MHFVVSGIRGVPESPLDTLDRPQQLAVREIDVPKDSIASILSNLMEQFEQAKSPHYVVRGARTTVVVTSSGQVGLAINVPTLFEAGGKTKSERTQGLEIEIERVDASCA